MVFKIKSLLFKCDFIGFIPQFRVLNEFRYKTLFSSILSILIIIFSIVFVTNSFLDFIDQNPKVEYYKNNDYETNKTFLISDSLLMIQYFFMCTSDFSKQPEMEIYLHAPLENRYEILQFEPCELGKNVNLKYKDLIKDFNSIEKWQMNEYFCINYNNSNLTLYNHPLLPHDEENYLQISIISDCEEFMLNVKLITQNDFIDHNKKENPIIPYYKRNEYHLNQNEKKILTYHFQYIKYESDNGFIFNNKKIINGIGEAGTADLDAPFSDFDIFSITFKINRANYDYYLRAFQKFQSFLAEIMSLINLIISISSIISEFLLYKKMNKDIIRYLLVSNEKKENNKEKIIFPKDKIFNQIFPIDKKTKKYKPKKIIKNNKVDDEQICKDSFNISNKDNILKEKSIDNEINNAMKDLNFMSIMRSFCCIKGKKLQIINLCNNIVNEDICIERILKRFYTLENNYNSLIEKNSNESDLNDNFSGIKKFVTEMDDESSNQTKIPFQTI